MYIISAIMSAVIIYLFVNTATVFYYEKNVSGIKKVFFYSKETAISAGVAAILFCVAAIIQHSRIEWYDYFRMCILVAVMSLLCVIDIKDKKIPNKILGIVFLVWLALTAIFIITDVVAALEKLGTALFGCFFCFLTFGITYVISKKSLGGGDVKLSLIMGLYLGSERIVGAILYAAVGCALFSIIGIISGKLDKKAQIPFCPFLFVGTVISLFFYV